MLADLPVLSLITVDSNEKKLAIFDDEEDILIICSHVLMEPGRTVHAFTDCDRILDKLADIWLRFRRCKS